MSTNAITDSEINAFIVAQNVKELNSVYFLSSCFVGAAAGILGLTNFAGFLFFFVSLLFSALCVSACRCVRTAQNHGDTLINLRSFVCHPAHYLPDGGWWRAILSQDTMFGYILLWTLVYGQFPIL